MRDFHPLHQGPDHRPCPTPRGLCQALLELGGNVREAPNDPRPFGLHGGLGRQLSALRFQVGDPLAEPADPGLERVLLEEPLGGAVEQPHAMGGDG